LKEREEFIERDYDEEESISGPKLKSVELI